MLLTHSALCVPECIEYKYIHVLLAYTHDLACVYICTIMLASARLAIVMLVFNMKDTSIELCTDTILKALVRTSVGYNF